MKYNYAPDVEKEWYEYDLHSGILFEKAIPIWPGIFWYRGFNPYLLLCYKRLINFAVRRQQIRDALMGLFSIKSCDEFYDKYFEEPLPFQKCWENAKPKSIWESGRGILNV